MVYEFSQFNKEIKLFLNIFFSQRRAGHLPTHQLTAVWVSDSPGYITNLRPVTRFGCGLQVLRFAGRIQIQSVWTVPMVCRLVPSMVTQY